MLTDKHCKNAVCPAGKSRARFTDAGGLYLEVSPAGSKRWFLECLIAYQGTGAALSAGLAVVALCEKMLIPAGMDGPQVELVVIVDNQPASQPASQQTNKQTNKCL